MEHTLDPKRKPLLALEFEEYSTLNKSYIVWILGYPIAVKEFFQSIILFVMVVLAFNFGYAGNGQVVQVASQLCTEGIYTPTTGLWIKCYPYSEGNALKWNCINNTVPWTDPFPEDFNHTINTKVSSA